MKRVYLDHNATTPLRKEVRERLVGMQEEFGGNPSSVHRSGRRARAELDESRARVAAALGVHEDEVLFTSGGTESVNLALLGWAGASRATSGIVTSAAEHSCVLGAASAAASRGFEVRRVGVDSRCRVDPEEVAAAVRGTAAGLVSIMAANNEVGTVQPLAAIGACLRSQSRERPAFHTDAVQALGRIPILLEEACVDLASFSAHKLGGPLGVGILVRRRGLALAPMIHGGGQETGLRAGSENVPAISAASVALELAVREQVGFASRARELSIQLWQEIANTLPDVELLGPPIESADRLPNTLDILLGGIDGRMLVARLDLEGLEASAGSACASGSLEPSHVLLAMGHRPEQARAGLRLSLGRETDRADIHIAVEILRRTARSMRGSDASRVRSEHE